MKQELGSYCAALFISEIAWPNGFDASHSFFDRRMHEDDPLRFVRPVTYAKERPNQHVTDYLTGESFFEDLLGTKSKDWEFETEWSMIIAGVSDMTQHGTPGLDIIPVDAIREVFLGIKSGKELKDCATAFFLRICHRYISNEW